MIKKHWNKLNTNEKAMIGFIILLIIIVTINWKKVSKGINDGIKPLKAIEKLDQTR